MRIGRNEKCPCKSGKKFKNCCINDPKYTETQLNNGIPRKYMSEFALHTYSSQVTIVSPKLLENVDVSNASYHIYMINKIKRLSFVENSIKVLDTHVEIQIKHGGTLIDKIEIIEIPLHDDIVSYEFESDKILVMKDGYGGGLKADILWLYSTFSNEELVCEVLYVGQSFGKKGDRDALLRLKSHETLQKILVDILYEDINYEVAITLWEFTPRLIALIDGRNGFLVSAKEDKQHFEKVLSAPNINIDNQIINVTEAALINYFKPKYNDKFKNNFPDITHKGYTFYYNYDYNAIAVELDPSCVNIKIHSEHTGYSQFSPVEYLLNSEEKRKSMFNL
ncbi:YecA family protein [Cohnella faecalis]|uniref:SEC-C domain-containing protein n=1 Tax=Cohnella faecalis TaxID=2315694 RepID=A0A398CYG7_9BACL|nr:SEC-C domain-containing protein [Cohnella faecalis]RIE04867.1 SEC-C domain-containing protein [Cohnella faecalis]